MNEQLNAIFSRLKKMPEFSEADFTDVNAMSSEGDNALHYAVMWGDLSAAKALIDAGIDINKAGDLGYTPLHVACMRGNVEMVRFLIEKGADLFALSEGDAPFTKARIGGHDDVCDVLAPLMKEAQEHDPDIYVRARIAQLKREITFLEKRLARL
jgi:ankyrin repeat protein